MSLIMVYVTFPSQETVHNICKVLLEKKIISCANMFPVTSMYTWQGNIEQAQEWVAIIKTKATLIEMVRSEICKLHPYTTPAILELPITANEAFAEWVISETV